MSIPRWSPPLNIFKTRLNVKPQASRVGGAAPAINATAALDSDSIELLKSQQALDLDPHEPVGEGELRAVGGEQLSPAALDQLPARSAVGLAKLSHLLILSQRRRIADIDEVSTEDRPATEAVGLGRNTAAQPAQVDAAAKPGSTV